MSKRHQRRFFFLADKGEMRGEVTRPATPSEKERAFRFSQIVSSATPAPSNALLEALAEIMTAHQTSIVRYPPALRILLSSLTTI